MTKSGYSEVGPMNLMFVGTIINGYLFIRCGPLYLSNHNTSILQIP